MNPASVTIVFWLLSAVGGYLVARRANSFNHWGNGLVGVCLLSLAWLALPQPTVVVVKSPPKPIYGTSAAQDKVMEAIAIQLAETRRQRK